MKPYMVMTFSSTIACGDPYRVVVVDETDRPVLEMTAMSRQHAGRVAGGLLLLLQKLDSRRAVVLDNSVHSGKWRERAAA